MYELASKEPPHLDKKIIPNPIQISNKHSSPLNHKGGSFEPPACLKALEFAQDCNDPGQTDNLPHCIQTIMGLPHEWMQPTHPANPGWE